MKKIAIVGAGYAGLTAAILLNKEGNYEVTLLNEYDYFYNSIQFHQCFYKDISKLRIPIKAIADQFSFQFIQQKVLLKEIQSLNSSKKNTLHLPSGDVDFDYVIIATGSSTHPEFENPENYFTLEDLKKCNFRETFASLTDSQNELNINVIGSGATGIQFAFEIRQYLQKKAIKNTINIITLDTSLLANFPPDFGSYVHKLANEAGINLYYQSRCESLLENSIHIKRFDDSIKKLDSDLALVFSGIKAAPVLFHCTAFGQLIVENEVLNNVFCIGDNSIYDSKGSNAPSAQTAVRKARAVVENIIRMEKTISLTEYDYQPLGYFISLGPGNGVGWMLNKNLITTGLTAYAIKETIEKQFEFFLNGLDTYI